MVSRISGAWGIDIPRPKNLVIHSISKDVQLVTGDSLRFLALQDGYVPFLSDTALLERFPAVRTDKGAIRFVCNGADVMRPGIVSYDEFTRGQVVCVAEERNKYLAVGTALVDSAEMASMEKGGVVKNLHYVSDRYWEAGKAVR